MPPFGRSQTPPQFGTASNSRWSVVIPPMDAIDGGPRLLRQSSDPGNGYTDTFVVRGVGTAFNAGTVQLFQWRGTLIRPSPSRSRSCRFALRYSLIGNPNRAQLPVDQLEPIDLVLTMKIAAGSSRFDGRNPRVFQRIQFGFRKPASLPDRNRAGRAWAEPTIQYRCGYLHSIVFCVDGPLVRRVVVQRVQRPWLRQLPSGWTDQTEFAKWVLMIRVTGVTTCACPAGPSRNSVRQNGAPAESLFLGEDGADDASARTRLPRSWPCAIFGDRLNALVDPLLSKPGAYVALKRFEAQVFLSEYAQATDRSAAAKTELT